MDKKVMMREEFAAVAHEMLAGWIQYMFDQCYPDIHNGDTVTAITVISNDACVDWREQADTAYADLAEEEKENRRIEADKMMRIVSSNFHHFDSDSLL